MKREDLGVVSSYLHDDVQEGDVLQVSAPAGDFALQTNDKPVVLISGGVGVTPMLSMLNHIAATQPEREVTFIHGALNSSVHAFRNHVAQLSNEKTNVKSFVVYSEPSQEDIAANSFDKQGFIDLQWLKSILSHNQADFYFCGPVLFMKAIYRHLKDWGVPTENIHFEFFGPAGQLEEPAAEVVNA